MPSALVGEEKFALSGAIPSVRGASGSEPDRLRKPQRIIHVIKHCGYGNGSVHVAIDLACMQAASGDTVTVVSSGGTFVPLLEQYGVKHVTLPHEQNQPLSVLSAAWKLAGLVRRERADVLHAHMMSSALIGYVASKLTGVPMVTTVHNSFDRHSVIMRLGRKVIAVSEAERKQLLARGYDADDLVAVMNAPNNSPRDAFMDDHRELNIQSPCIVVANGLHPRKGVADLIAACGTIFADHPGWRLYIAGEGPSRDDLEAQAKQVGIADRTVFLGFLPGPRPLLEKADIFVLASYADPCSLAVGEARSAGCAIVATNVGGTPEMLDFGRAGRLVKPGDVVQLAIELRKLMEDDDARHQLRQAALEGCEIFDVRRLVNDYAQVYADAKRA